MRTPRRRTPVRPTVRGAPPTSLATTPNQHLLRAGVPAAVSPPGQSLPWGPLVGAYLSTLRCAGCRRRLRPAGLAAFAVAEGAVTGARLYSSTSAGDCLQGGSRWRQRSLPTKAAAPPGVAELLPAVVVGAPAGCLAGVPRSPARCVGEGGSCTWTLRRMAV